MRSSLISLLPILSLSTRSVATMSGKFIVVFKEHVTKDQIQAYANELEGAGGKVTNHYDTVLNGFAATIPESFLGNFQSNDAVDYIEPDGVVTTQ